MTFTKDQLIARINQVKAINKYRISRDSDADGLVMDNELFAIALASLEAEPVAYMIGGHYLMHAQDPKVDNYASSVPLYTTPQPLTTSERAELENYRNAQQVVPDALSGDIDADDHPLLWSYNNGWNACRAAMQSGAVKDGWVACSERMPLTAQENCLYEDIEVQVFDGKSVFIAHYSIGSLPEPWGAWMDTYADITHWQPLAAAPQQELSTHA